MSKIIPGNQKHLLLEDRLFIMQSLNQGLSFKEIAKYLCKDPSSISKEVKKHRASNWYHKGSFLNKRNFCVHRFQCRKTNVCRKIVLCGIKCTSCPSRNQTCKDFKKEARKKDKIITPLIAKGQSPYQILVNHPELQMSVRTMYSYIDQGIFTSKNIDLKRKVTFKPRKCHKTQISNREIFHGRRYEDFLKLGLNAFVEMDTVHSCRDSQKTLLTFFFTEEKLFLAYLLNRCTKGAVKAVFDRLERRFEDVFDFQSIFEYILTDRGSEFGDPVALETNPNGIQRSSIYYCDPMRSGQKGGLEQAHTMLRMILPKGSSFAFLTQWDVNRIVNHINSTPRESLNGDTPYQRALNRYGEDVLKALQLGPIHPDEVCLRPKLIRFK